MTDDGGKAPLSNAILLITLSKPTRSGEPIDRGVVTSMGRIRRFMYFKEIINLLSGYRADSVNGVVSR